MREISEFKKVLYKLSKEDQDIIENKIDELIIKAFDRGMTKGYGQAKKRYYRYLDRGQTACTNT